MAEFNPYKLEEEKWTPKNVYEILPPNAVSWSDYEFGQGTDNVDGEAAKKSFIDGFVDFFKDLFGVAGQILGGALELGGKILGGLVEGVKNLIGGIANAIGSIFGGGPTESPYPPMFSPIKANLEAAIQPFRDQIDESLDKSRDLLAEQLVLSGQIAEQVDITRAAVADAKAASERAGVAIGEAEAALAAAEDARETLEEYNEALTKQITAEFNAAVGRADTAVEKANTLAGELEDFKDKHQLEIDDAIGKAEQAVADLATLSPQVADAVAQSAAATDNVAALTPQVSEAVAQAGEAVDTASQTLAEYTAWSKAQKTRIDSAVSKAEAATANVGTLTPQVADAVAKAGKASGDVTALTPKVTAASEDAARASQDVATLTPKVTDAVSKANKASADVSTLTPKVDDAAAKAAKASTDVSALTPKVTAAQNKANQAANDLSTLTPKVTAAQSRADSAYTEAGKVRTDLTPKITAAQTKADTAVADLTKLEPKVTAAQSRADSAYTEAGKVRSEVSPKIEAAQTKGENALAVADKAVDWLRNPNEIGASLIVIDPETGKPNWAEHLVPVPAEENPLNLPNAYKTGDYYYRNPRRMAVNVDPSTEYIVSLWVKADKPGSDMAYDIRNQSGEHVFQKSREVPDFPSSGDAWRPYWITDVPTEWTQYKKIATPREASRTAEFAATYFNHSNGDTRDAVQYIADFQIYPLVPSQLDVDQAQNDAIRANSEILRQQDEINEAQRVANLANQAFIDNQTKWNTASTNATKANTELLRHQGLINDAQAAANAAQKDFNDNQTKWNTASTNATKALADAAKAQSDINAEQAKFNTFQTDFNTKQTKWNTASTNATKALADSTSALSKIATEQGKLNALQSDFNTKQIDWNNAVTRSLNTQKVINDNFNEWTAGAATAIAANTTAIKALSKIDTGESLIAYLTPTDAEVKAGTAKYDVPVWTTGAHREFSGNNPPPEQAKYAFGAASNGGTLAARKVPVTVRPGTKYILSFWAYGSGKLVIYLQSSGTGNPVRYNRQLMVDQDTLQILTDAEGRRLYDPAENGNSSNANGTQWLLNGFKPDQLYKWVHYKFEVEFTASTTEVWFQNFYWNWTETSTYGQYLAGMQFYPDVPTQASVDSAQNKAIETFDLFMGKQDDWNKGTKAALDTQKTVDDNFQKWADGAATAIEANTKAIAILGSPQGASSIIPISPLTKEPYYLGWAGDRLSVENINSVPTRAAVKFTGTTRSRTYASSDQLVPVKVARGQVYRWVAWTYSNVANSSVLLYFRDPATGTGTASTSHDEESKTYGHSSYGLYIQGIPSGWNKVSGTMTFKDEISSIEMYSVGWNYSNLSSSVTQYITGFDIAPDVPTQASVDKAQNDAIGANTEALKALGKKVLGASLVPYKTPSTQEVKDYAAGNLSYDPWADPEYFDAGYSLSSNSTYGRYTRVNSTQGTNDFPGTLVSVDSSIEYRVKFDAYAADEGSILVVHMKDQSENSAIQSSEIRDSGQMAGSIYLIDYLTLKKGWSTYSGRIKFKPSTTSARLSTFYWNHSSGVSTTQCLTNLEIVPNIPDANVVNLLQDQAILETSEIGKENRKAIDALTEGLEAYVAAADLIEAREEMQAELEQQSIAREELEKKLNDAIVEAVPRTIIYDSGKPQFNDHFEALERTKVIAKKGWVGQMVLDVTWRDGDKRIRDIKTYPVPGTNDNRTYNVPSASFGSYHPEYRIDYWVYQGKSVQHNLSNSGAYLTGSTHKGNTWTQIVSHTVKKTNGVVYFRWTTKLKKADRGRTYYFDVRVNGTSVIPKSFKGYGPMTGLGDGRATLTFSGTLNVPDNGTITVHTKSTGNATQAGVSSNKGMVSYLELE